MSAEHPAEDLASPPNYDEGGGAVRGPGAYRTAYRGAYRAYLIAGSAGIGWRTEVWERKATARNRRIVPWLQVVSRAMMLWPGEPRRLGRDATSVKETGMRRGDCGGRHVSAREREDRRRGERRGGRQGTGRAHCSFMEVHTEYGLWLKRGSHDHDEIVRSFPSLLPWLLVASYGFSLFELVVRPLRPLGRAGAQRCCGA